MKKVLSIASIVVLTLSFASCNKCTICKYTEDDGTTTTSDVCGKGKSKKEALSQYERAGWYCQ